MSEQNITTADPRQIKATKASFQNLYEQLEFGRFNSVKSGAAPTVYQEKIAVQDQREFKLDGTTYVVGDHSLQVFVNGQLMREGEENDYKELNNTTIEFTFGLDADDVVVLRVNGGTSGASLHESYRALAGQTVFELAGSYTTDNHSLVVFVNGAYQTKGVDYEETDANTVTFLEALDSEDLVTFRVEGLPSVQGRYSQSYTERIYNNRKELIYEEQIADGLHIIKEYFYNLDGTPARMTIQEAGYTTTRTYTWSGFQCIGIDEEVTEG